MKEIFKDVFGYEGLYKVSNMGRVKSLEREQRLWHGGKRVNPGRILKQCANSWGCLMVTLHKSGKQKVYTVHILVARAFLGERPGHFRKIDVCHRDGNEQNPELSNLRYDTRSGNYKDRIAHGADCSGEGNPAAKLNHIKAAEIRRRLDAGEFQKDIAFDYSVSQGAISRIKLNKCWVAK